MTERGLPKTRTELNAAANNSQIDHFITPPELADSQPESDADTNPEPTPVPTPVPFTLDGTADSAGYLQFSNGMTLYAAVRAGFLYVATWSPGNSGGANDHFIFVNDQLLAAASAPAPWAKSGTVAIAANKPFMGGESAGTFCGWFNAPASPKVAKSAASSGQMEGTIDLAAAFGSIPQTVYISVGAYSTADGGVSVAEAPLGNNNGNLEPNEFIALPIVTLKDENADGKYDRLYPRLDFVVTQITRTNNSTSLAWNAVPGRTYRVEGSPQLHGPWTQIGGLLTPGGGELTLSVTDSLSFSQRFYRVNLVNPGPDPYGQSTLSPGNSRNSSPGPRERARSKARLRADQKARRS